MLGCGKFYKRNQVKNAERKILAEFLKNSLLDKTLRIRKPQRDKL